MLLCRAPRLLTASLDPVLKSPGSFVLLRVKANRAGDVTLTLRKGHTLQRYRCLCASAGGSPTPARPDHHRQQQHHHNRDSPAFISADWGHMNRVATIAASLSGSASRVPAAGGALFTSRWKMSTGAGTGATQPSRAASSTAAGKKRVDEEPRDKQDEQNPKEAPTDSSSTTGVPAGPEPDGEKPNKTQQLKKVFKEYGAVGVSFHIGMSLMSLGMFYLLVSSGIDMAAVLCKLGFSEAIIQSKMAAGTSTFVLAYAVHKLFAPVRISITLVSVPLIVRYFRKTGLFKPPTPAP